MHISIFLQDLRGGGAERVMVTLSDEFAARGHDVDLVLTNQRGSYIGEVSDQVSIIPLKTVSIPGYSALGATPALIRYLRQVAPDSMLSALTQNNIVAVLARELAQKDVRLVLSERNNLSIRMSKDPRMRLFPTLINVLYPRADAITAVSQGVAKDLETTAGLTRDEIAVIHNPSVTDDVLKGRQKPVNHPWFNEEDVSVILAVGSLTRQKDFSTLIEAFDRLRQERPLKLVILGEGNRRSALEEMVESRGLNTEVDLPGFVNTPSSYMAAADVFVLSSRWEGLPNVLIEAMACMTPVVATDCPSGPREILKDGKYGPLVPVGDDEAMAAAIEQMLNDPTSGEKLINRAMTFRPEPIADQYLKILFPEDE